MSWTEVVEKRIKKGRVYQDDADPLLHTGTFSIATLHYESSIDSDTFDAQIDCAPVRVDVPSFDGWRITSNGWHFALGKDIAGHGQEDGWIGFGGRQGQHWAKFRLLRVGYLHWPTRAWDDVGGAPTYDRGDLFRETYSKVIGPNQDSINVESWAAWANLWTTPGGGALDVTWKVRGEQLKEEIVINQAAREWISTNRPPATPLPETWFGFVFQLDWSDVPRIYREGVLKSPDDDFADDGQPIYLRDALDRLLAFMPLDTVMAGVKGRAGGGVDREPLRKRFYSEGGDHYLLVGVRCDLLNAMKAGPLTFDPTYTVAETNEDACSPGDDGFVTNTPAGMRYSVMYLGWDAADPNLDGGWIWETAIEDAPTIQTATVTLDDGGGDRSLPLAGAWWGFDIDSVGDFTNDEAIRVSDHETRTTATVTDNINTAGNHTSPSLVTIVQEICDRAGVGANPRIGLTWRNTDTSSSYYEWSDYSDSAALAADLIVTWTTAGVTLPVFYYHYAHNIR
jgi:hypothetical protein